MGFLVTSVFRMDMDPILAGGSSDLVSTIFWLK